MVQRLYQRLTHHSRRRHGAVNAVTRHHINDGSDPTTLLTHHQTIGLFKFNLSRSVGTVAELILDTLNRQVVASPVGPPAGHQKTRDRLFPGFCQYQKSITHGR